MTPRIPDYYVGKHVLVTGATGLMGKALVEKLLRSCPGVERIYVIIRSKRGSDPNERWAKVTQKPLFNLLKSTNPDALSKVVVIPGDNTEDNFGLSDEHQILLKENINIIFHGSASISFAESLVDAIKTNVKATYTLLELARQWKHVECFVHVSTSYSNFAMHGNVEEKVYRSHLDWRVMLDLIEDEKNGDLINILQTKLMEGHASTYTLSKGMAEDVVSDYRKYFPVQIARPALVIGAVRDPLPGWMDAENFLTLISKGARMGMIRVVLANRDTVIECTNLDMGIRAFIVGPWRHHFIKANEGTEVYCCRMDDEFKLTMGDLFDNAIPFIEKFPPKNILLWYPFVISLKNFPLYRIYFVLLHVIPAVIFDSALRISGRKPKVLKVYQKLWAMNDLSKYYLSPHNKFLNNNYQSYENDLLEEDKKDFSMVAYGQEYSPKDVIDFQCIGAMKYLWDEDLENHPKSAYVRYRKAKIIHYTFCSILAGLLGSCLMSSLLPLIL